MLSAYHERLRGAELRDLNEVNLESGPPASRRLTRRFRNVVLRIFTRRSHERRTSD
jgi:hypothetical protein